MDQEMVNYIVTYYSNLYTVEEKQALDLDVVRMTLGDDKANEYERLCKTGNYSEEEEYLELVGLRSSEFNFIVASRLMKEFGDKIFFNRCSKCNWLARTPLAKQCRHCGHDWH